MFKIHEYTKTKLFNNNVALKTTNLRLLKTVYYKAIDCAT